MYGLQYPLPNQIRVDARNVHIIDYLRHIGYRCQYDNGAYLMVREVL